MATPQRTLDVWIVETNVVYRDVPFAVVADWVQQGRLLEDDKLRPAGGKDWLLVGEMKEFSPYLPREEPTRPQDKAEALEPVQLEFAWKPRRDEEEDDPDMIPLIDVSLVLLIFFMMTTTSIAIGSTISQPPAYYGYKTSDTNLIWVGIDSDPSREPTTYMIGMGDKPAEISYPVQPGENSPSGGRSMPVPLGFLKLLDERLAQASGPVEVVIRTDKNLKDGFYLSMLVELQKRGIQVVKKYDGVEEKKEP